MGRQKKSAKQPNKASGNSYLVRVHPSLRAKFVPLPKAGETLTDEQLLAIFDGDLSALRDVIQLVHQPIPQNSDQ